MISYFTDAWDNPQTALAGVSLSGKDQAFNDSNIADCTNPTLWHFVALCEVSERILWVCDCTTAPESVCFVGDRYSLVQSDGVVVDDCTAISRCARLITSGRSAPRDAIIARTYSCDLDASHISSVRLSLFVLHYTWLHAIRVLRYGSQ
jgi:hypothetical protein